MLDSQFLREVQQLIVKHGWIQGAERTDKGYCLLGAIKEVSQSVGDYRSEPYFLIRQLLEEENIIPSEYGLASYNDFPGRTKEEVIEVLNRTIQLAKLKERANVST